MVACACEALEQFLPAADAFTACAQAIEKGIVDEPIFALQVYFALAEHHRRLERRDVAVTWYQQALKQLQFVLNPAALAEASARLSRRHLENVHSTMSDWYAARSRVLYELVGARQLFTQAASNLGLTLEELGNTQASEQQLRQTIEFCKLLGTPRQGILTRIALADLLLERHEAQEAEHFAREALALCRPTNKMRWRKICSMVAFSSHRKMKPSTVVFWSRWQMRSESRAISLRPSACSKKQSNSSRNRTPPSIFPRRSFAIARYSTKKG